MRMRWHYWLLWSGVVLLAAPHAGALASRAADQEKTVDAGRTVYLEKCASCHGETATGHGPEAKTLPRPPIDLTALSDQKRPFDRASVRSGITGHIRFVAPGGPSGMPYWRQSLDGALPAAGDGVTELDAILAFLETIQRQGVDRNDARKAALVRAGQPLFATHCAACHGANGLGLTASGSAAGVAAPNLTTMATRNGGHVDFGSIYEAIARRDHTGGEMPSWERAFRKAGWPAAIAAKNIEAIARYVESIQQR